MGININEVFQTQSNWLKAVDLKKQKHRVEIEKVELVDFEQDGKKEQKLGIHFKNRSLGLICNKTNAGTIAYILGPDTDGWIGQTIILYPTMVDFGGRSVEAIRVEMPMQEAVPQQIADEFPTAEVMPQEQYGNVDFDSDIPF